MFWERTRRGMGHIWLQEKNELSYKSWNIRVPQSYCLKSYLKSLFLPFWKCTSVCSRRSEVCGPAVLYFPASWPYRSGPANALKWTPPPGAWTWCPCCRFQRCAFDRSREVSWSPAMDTNQVLDEQQAQRLYSVVKMSSLKTLIPQLRVCLCTFEIFRLTRAALMYS